MGVWPDAGIKIAQMVPKDADNVTPRVYIQKVMFIKPAQ